MVHPVRAAACPAWRICRAIDSPLWCRRPWQTHACRAGAGWGHLSPSEGAIGGPGRWRSYLARPVWAVRDNLAVPVSLLQPAHDRTRVWQPWPTDSADSDRLEIHWPSDDRPELPPRPIDDDVVETRPQVMWWRDVGGFLDMWA